ncbi:MAG: hypothetical protein DID92_2727743478 [Candidatus Nitrotoga sp. SPKER]|nr:MAG: hypothetical protein DID92_2727743478 [Candidatus Nitrotoga sp. SPKER]
MLKNFILSLLSGVLLAVVTYYVVKYRLLRRLFLRRYLRCIVPYKPGHTERMPGAKN